mmetsp:Transcript_42415/g.91538  ORF Transcript_42415/g.91538 Transcript_42415/m.91538 type:complete len:110 (-) Transcript_42415:371-700(-)
MEDFVGMEDLSKVAELEAKMRRLELQLGVDGQGTLQERIGRLRHETLQKHADEGDKVKIDPDQPDPEKQGSAGNEKPQGTKDLPCILSGRASGASAKVIREVKQKAQED